MRRRFRHDTSTSRFHPIGITVPLLRNVGSLRRELYSNTDRKLIILMTSVGGRLSLLRYRFGRCTNTELPNQNCASAGGERITYGWLQRSRGVNDRFTSSVFTLQKALSEYAWHNSRSSSTPLDRAHRIFSVLKSAPLCTSSFPG